MSPHLKQTTDPIKKRVVGAGVGVIGIVVTAKIVAMIGPADAVSHEFLADRGAMIRKILSNTQSVGYKYRFTRPTSDAGLAVRIYYAETR